MAANAVYTAKPVRTIRALIMRPVEVELPALVEAHTDADTVDDALTAYYDLSTKAGVAPDRETVVLFRDAMQAGDALCVTYTHDGETTGRVLYPHAMGSSKDGGIYVRAFCTFRREVRCFRLDAMNSVHYVVPPNYPVDGAQEMPAETAGDLLVDAIDDAERVPESWSEYETMEAAQAAG